MRPYDKAFPNDIEDIQQLLNTSKGNLSPQMVIDYIKDHQHMYFGTADLTNNFVNIILYAINVNYPELAMIITKEFEPEIDMSVLLAHSITYEVDPYIVDQFFDIYKKSERAEFRNTEWAIFAQALRKIAQDVTTDYYDIFAEDAKFIGAFRPQDFETVFNFIFKNMMLKPEIVKAMKQLTKYDNVASILADICERDTEFLEVYFPEAADVFLF